MEGKALSKIQKTAWQDLTGCKERAWIESKSETLHFESCTIWRNIMVNRFFTLWLNMYSTESGTVTYWIQPLCDMVHICQWIMNVYYIVIISLFLIKFQYIYCNLQFKCIYVQSISFPFSILAETLTTSKWAHWWFVFPWQVLSLDWCQEISLCSSIYLAIFSLQPIAKN